MENGSKPATQADLQAVKTELKGDIARLDKKIEGLAVEQARTNLRIDKLDDGLHNEMRENTSRILEAIDSFAGKAQMYDRKAYSHEDALGTHTKQLSDHEKRLKTLEAES